MSKKPQPPNAIVVLPVAAAGSITDPRLRRWLSRGQLARIAADRDVLGMVLDEIGHDAGNAGLAALRFWGQTGERSAAWMAAADPIHLAAGLNNLCAYTLRGDNMPLTDLRDLVDHLQLRLGSNEVAFARLGHCAYIRGDSKLASAAVSADIVHGRSPDEWMPQGEGAATYDRLQSEIQMVLHDHEINTRREAQGLPAVNSLWIWGGGVAPQATTEAIPVLFADDSLLRGFWLSRNGIVERGSDSFEDQARYAMTSFVSVIPDTHANREAAVVQSQLQTLLTLLHKKEIAGLTLLFRDGVRVQLLASDRFKFWRRTSALLDPA